MLAILVGWPFLPLLGDAQTAPWRGLQGQAHAADSVLSLAAKPSPQLQAVFNQIRRRQKQLGMTAASRSIVQQRDGLLAFASEAPRQGVAKTGDFSADGLHADHILRVVTMFSAKTDTVSKRVIMKEDGNETSFRVVLDPCGKPFKRSVRAMDGGEALVYERAGDTIIYTQTANERGGVDLKEWIYAAAPNAPNGSRYVWHFHSDLFRWPLSLRPEPDGTVNLYRVMPINGVDPRDKAKRAHVVKSVRQAIGSRAYFPDEEKLASIPPSLYWDGDGLQKQADIQVLNENTFVLMVNAAPGDYPLLIDPALGINGKPASPAAVRWERIASIEYLEEFTYGLDGPYRNAQLPNRSRPQSQQQSTFPWENSSISKKGITINNFCQDFTALKQGLIEYTIPDKLNSRLQKYRLTTEGQQYKT